MPVTASAKKKMRQDKKRRVINLRVMAKLKSALKKARSSPSEKNLKTAFSLIDQAGKKRIIHKNKAARLKSRLSQKLKK
ncbi:30S ribosomal protein S20 [Candidatus Gottesmanbacteria bacterium]|nr:30S ribosomal protein S20 [Candidatus Gottesmanbacteria bacterium]